MRRFLLLVTVAAVAGLLLTRAEPFGPTVVLETPVDAIGRATPLTVSARDRGTGLARLELRLVPGGGTPVIVEARDFPPRSLGWPWAIGEESLAVTIDAAATHVPEGPATLEVWATDHSWLAAFHHRPQLSRPVTVDLTPPSLEVLSAQHVAHLGGSECAVYRVGADAVSSGVQVGAESFPGSPGLFTDGALRAALFAIPEDQPDAHPTVVAVDAAGNRRSTNLDVEVRKRVFADKTLTLSDDFLSRKVPELLQANGLDPSGDLVAGYLRINRELRVTTEQRLHEICRDSAPTPLWEGAFLRLPNAAPLSGFADRRSYVYHGTVVDKQTHLGVDLASLRASPVPAGNTGRVVFTGPLGIYGNTVVLDHGFGLFSLYGHLSAIAVNVGVTVKRGDTIGNTGDTGLAAGDHLHFSIMVRGVHVDPVEWWDGHWIHDHVEARLAAFPRAGGGP